MIPYLLKKTKNALTHILLTHQQWVWTAPVYLQELFHKIITTTLHNLWLLESRNGKSGKWRSCLFDGRAQVILGFSIQRVGIPNSYIVQRSNVCKNIWMLTVWNHRWVNTIRTLFLYLRGEKGTFFKVLLLPRLQLLFWNFC